MEPFYRNFLTFSSVSLWGSSEASSSPDGESPAERGLWDVAVEVYNVVKWLFQAFRENFIVCYLSDHISEADRSVQVTIPKIIDRWFDAKDIPFSSRMNPQALIAGLRGVEAFEQKALAVIIAGFAKARSLEIDKATLSEMTAEFFVREHVMTLPEEETLKISNPVNSFAFWLSTEDLKKDFQTIEESILEDLKTRMGVPGLEIDPFVHYCTDKMAQLKVHLERLASSGEE